MELWSAHTSAGGRQGTDYTDVYDRSKKTGTTADVLAKTINPLSDCKEYLTLNIERKVPPQGSILRGRIHYVRA